jgi:AcrR family transcriptional regulator
MYLSDNGIGPQFHDTWSEERAIRRRVGQKRTGLAEEAGAEDGMKAPDTHQKLIDAVIAIVFENGYAGATMERIAKRAGLTRGAIQHHFGDKRVDLMVAACAQVLERRQHQYEASIKDLARANLGGARAGLKAAYSDPATWFLLEIWIASKSDQSLRDRVETHLQTERSIGDDTLTRTLAEIGDSSVDFRVYKYAMRALTRGLALEYSRRPDREFFDQVVDFVLDALEGSIATKKK